MTFTFDPPLIRGRLKKRYKRFLADIQLETGEVVTAHCPNSGSMKDIKEEGLSVWVQHNPDSKNKLKYRWELVEADNTLIVANTMMANKVVEQALESRLIKEVGTYTSFRREVKYGTNSRIDFCLDYGGERKGYVEVKSVHMKRGELAVFPDSVTTRGTKHLEELIEVVEQGYEAFVCFLVQRSDCLNFQPATSIDPSFSSTLKKAIERGVHVFSYCTQVTPEGIEFSQKIPILKPELWKELG